MEYELEQECQRNPASLVKLLQETAVLLWKEWPKKMRATALDNKTNFSLVGICPHCRHDSVFIQATAVFAEFITNFSLGSQYRLVAAMRCQGCKQFILGQVTHVGTQFTYTHEAHFPIGKPDDDVAEEIPPHIQVDFKEALRCQWVNAYNATAEMCRRAVEASCLDLGAPDKDWLEDKIDWLEQQRKITPFLRDVAHKVRLGGNRGAHPGIAPAQADPQSPDIQSESAITDDHAKAIVKFTTEFFHHVYVVPKQLDKYDFSKPKKAKP